MLFTLLMMMVLMADAIGSPTPQRLHLPGWQMPVALLTPYLLLMLGSWIAARWTLRRLDRKPQLASNTLAGLDWFSLSQRVTMVLIFAIEVKWLGGVTWIRRHIADVILVPQLIALSAPLITLCVSWRAYYPIDARLRTATLMRTLDSGSPVQPIWTAGQFVLTQFRHNVLMVLAPLLLLMAWEQFVDRHIDVSENQQAMLTLAGSACVFLFAPLLIRVVWDTVPLPPGQLRQELLALCADHRVRIRQLLLWRTYGGVINGAVLGFVGVLRYILLTDALIERLDDREVEAVMAHEIGHIRKHHMPALVICLAALVGVGSMLYEQSVKHLGDALQSIAPLLPDIVFGGLSLTLVLTAFGWVSRQFERQADTFAVQHLSTRYGDATTTGLINAAGVAAFSSALLRVASLNHIPAHRRSWRHGSIRSRLDYLRSIVGTPVDQCRIDRQVPLIALAGLLTLLTTLALGYYTL